MIAYIAVFLFAALATFVAFLSARSALFIAVFLLPWFGLEADVGLRVTAYQVALCTLWVRLAFQRSIWGNRTMAGALIPFAVYMVIRSALQMPFLPQAEIEGGIFRGPGLRPIAQIVYFLVTLMPVFVLSRIYLQTNDVIRLGKTYVASCVVLAAIGWVQVAVWYATGSNPLPIGFLAQYFNPEIHVGSGVIELAGQSLYRMNSFGGEPKDLGRALVAALVVMIAGALGGVVGGKTVASVGGFLIASVLMTMSTSAFALLAIGSVVIIAASRISGALKGATTAAVVHLAVVLFVGLAITGYVLAAQLSPQGTDGPNISQLIESRTTERGQVLEDFDEAVVSYLVDDLMALLIGVGMGNVHLYAEDYLGPEIAVFAAGTPFTGKHGLVRVIADGGLLALALCVVVIADAVSRALRALRRGQAYKLDVWIGCSLVLAFFFMFMGNNGLAPHLYLALGLLYQAMWKEKLSHTPIVAMNHTGQSPVQQRVVRSS